MLQMSQFGPANGDRDLFTAGRFEAAANVLVIACRLSYAGSIRFGRLRGTLIRWAAKQANVVRALYC
jgi:hypothetical protein